MFIMAAAREAAEVAVAAVVVVAVEVAAVVVVAAADADAKNDKWQSLEGPRYGRKRLAQQ
jgi:hypothetical protein